jgi:hypothetical protein
VGVGWTWTWACSDGVVWPVPRIFIRQAQSHSDDSGRNGHDSVQQTGFAPSMPLFKYARPLALIAAFPPGDQERGKPG